MKRVWVKKSQLSPRAHFWANNLTRVPFLQFFVNLTIDACTTTTWAQYVFSCVSLCKGKISVIFNEKKMVQKNSLQCHIALGCSCEACKWCKRDKNRLDNNTWVRSRLTSGRYHTPYIEDKTNPIALKKKYSIKWKSTYNNWHPLNCLSFSSKAMI